MTMEHQDAKVLRRAAEIVDQGWCQNALALTVDGKVLRGDTQETFLHPQAGQWCLLGAIMLAYREVTGSMDGRGWCDVYLRVNGHVRGASAIAWNNAPGRTADEVAALMRRVAEEA